MFKFKKIKTVRIQLVLTILLWLLVFTIPLLFGEFDEGVNWDHIFRIWKEYILILGIFLLNHFVLLPYLFFREKRVLYFISIACVITCVVLVMYVFKDPNPLGNMPGPPSSEAPFLDPPPRHSLEQGPPPDFGPRGPRPRREGSRELIPPFANLLIFSILVIGFDTGLVFSVKWIEAEQNKLRLEKENVENKMAFLQNQISPHFFMNTLNNIHALIDISGEEAKASVLKLSKMMTHLLYETQTERVSFRKEIEFIESYVELMKLRFTEHVKVELDIAGDLPDIKVPPLLSISFVENAFKHGVSYEDASFIRIRINKVNDRILFRIENSNHAKEALDSNSGIGMENSRNRLDLLYGSDYVLKVDSGENFFSVYLSVPV